MLREADRHKAFERKLGVGRAQRLLSIYCHSHPCGTALDFLMGEGTTKQQAFRRRALDEGYTRRELAMFEALQE